MQNNIKNTWIQLVADTYREICIRHNVMLQYPVFNFHKSEKCLGYWERKTRVLSLSLLLFEQYSWQEVEQVLRHEMAHQLVDELPELLGIQRAKKQGHSKIWSKKRKCRQRPQTRPHGAEFTYACKILGVEPEFASASALTEEDLDRASAWRNQDNGNPVVQLIRKVEKLLALAKSANEHEAQLALEKAQNLMEKNHLERIMREEVSYRSLTINLQRKNVAFWQNHLFVLLQEFFMVRVIITSTIDLPVCKECKAIDIFGTPENVVVAEYCYHFVCNHTAELWKQKRTQFGKDARRHRNSYFLGVVLGFREKLAEQRKQCPPSPLQTLNGQKVTNALIVQKKEEEAKRLEEFIHQRYNGGLQKKSSRTKVYNDSFDAGHSDGQQLSFSDGIERGNKENRGRFLE